jgi:hypothetical protein
MKYDALIMWLEDRHTQFVTLSDESVNDVDDEQIFFYVEKEDEIKDLMQLGAEDFIILSYNKK